MKFSYKLYFLILFVNLFLSFVNFKGVVIGCLSYLLVLGMEK